MERSFMRDTAKRGGNVAQSSTLLSRTTLRLRGDDGDDSGLFLSSWHPQTNDPARGEDDGETMLPVAKLFPRRRRDMVSVLLLNDNEMLSSRTKLVRSHLDFAFDAKSAEDLVRVFDYFSLVPAAQ